MTWTASQLLTEDKVVRMLNVCFNSRDRVLISMLYEGGFRVKELGTLPGNRSRSTITA
jgi:site-specific recombinase XerD